jgi:hypothetical protein
LYSVECSRRGINMSGYPRLAALIIRVHQLPSVPETVSVADILTL